MTPFKQFAVLSLTLLAIGSSAFASESTLMTGLASNTSSGGRIMAGRDIVVLAKDDIDTFRATGTQSEFLKEVVARISKINRVSEPDVLLELKK
jgi:hypothetical protein